MLLLETLQLSRTEQRLWILRSHILSLVWSLWLPLRRWTQVLGLSFGHLLYRCGLSQQHSSLLSGQLCGFWSIEWMMNFAVHQKNNSLPFYGKYFGRMYLNELQTLCLHHVVDRRSMHLNVIWLELLLAVLTIWCDHVQYFIPHCLWSYVLFQFYFAFVNLFVSIYLMHMDVKTMYLNWKWCEYWQIGWPWSCFS